MTAKSGQNERKEIVLPQVKEIDINPSPPDSERNAVSPPSESTDESGLREIDAAPSASIRGLGFINLPPTPIQRVLLFAVSLFLIAGFVLAASLEPATRGYGTHQQLGLPPCSIQVLFGIPCPSCGMTTSFAWFVRGNLLESARANPAGLYLAMLCLITIPWAILSGLKNRFLLTSRPEYWALRLTAFFVVISGIQWFVRYWLAV